jgi:glycosyltransferase involved in cell wall biosynthesis
MATAIYFVAETMIEGSDVPGFASLIVSVTFLAGIQLLSLGVIGEYIGRIFAEVKGRPLYLVQNRVGCARRGGEALDRMTIGAGSMGGDPHHG